MSPPLDTRVLPKVTIAIPTYNRCDYLKAAVDSSLAQTYPHLEIVVSDNASTDGTAAWLQGEHDARLITLRQTTNLGMMGNWDACLAQATGEYFLLLSDDDLLERDAIARLVEVILGTSSVSLGMVYGRADIIGPQGELLDRGATAPSLETAHEAIEGFFLSRRPTYPCTILLRTEDLRAAGGYSYEGLTLSCDARAWMAAAMRHGHVGFVPEVVAKYRVHPGRLTVQTKIETWLDNNVSLARYCSNAFSSLGQQSVAKRVLSLVKKMNARSAMFLVQDIAELKQRPLGKIRRYLTLYRYFDSPRCFPTVALMAMRLAKPKFLSRAIRQIRQMSQLSSR